MNCSGIKIEELVEQTAYLAFTIILNYPQLLQTYEHFLFKVIYFLNPISTYRKTSLLIIQAFLHQNSD